MKKSLAVALMLAGAFGAVASAQADPRARFMAANCAYCHGPEGKSRGAIPSLAGPSSLAGTDQKLFIDAMKAFKDGSRFATVMQKHASGYTEAEYAAMAKYFASIK